MLNDTRRSGRWVLGALLLTMAGPTWSVAQTDSPSPPGDRLTLAEIYALARERNARVATAAALADARAVVVPSAGLPPTRRSGSVP